MDLTVRGRAGDEPVPAPSRRYPPEAAQVSGRVPEPQSKRVRVAVGVVLAVAVVLRFVTWSNLWLDEALTVNIASLPLDEIPAALRRDGAPPLYYVLLHGWMQVFGTGDLAVRALSGLFSVATLPLMWVTGRRLGGRRVAWAALLALATSPFAVRYATEARMYSLVMLLTVVGGLSLMELLERPSRRAAVGLALVSGLLLYSHYWSFYLLATVGSLLAVRAARDPDPAGPRRSLAAMAAGCLLFLPWVPTFVYQLANTGTPWGVPGNLRSFFDTVTHFAGGYWDLGIALGLVYFALITLGVVGRGVGDGRIELDLRGHGPGRFLGAVVLGTLALAVVAGRLGGSAYAVRYAAVVFPVLVLLMALGADAFTSPRAHRTALGVVVALGLAACIPNVVGDRTSAGRVAAALRSRAAPGDVVAYCPDQLGPPVSRLLPADNGLDQLTFPRSGSPQFVDWVGYAAASKSAVPADFARMLVDRAGPRDIWLVWAPGYRTYKAKCQALLSELHEIRENNTRVVTVSSKYLERPGLAHFPA